MRGASITLRDAGRHSLRTGFAALMLALASTLGGCANNGAAGGDASGALALASGSSSGPTVAFESIDGPPPQVFDRMVGVLDSESKLRSLTIVSRETAAAFRVRGYLSAQVVSGKTMIAWVWDVYDRNQRRALRLSGEEAAGKAGRDPLRDPWTAADDLVLRKIAQAGFSGLSNMINGTPPQQQDAPPSAPAPGKHAPAIANADEPAPASSGIAALSYSAQ